MVITATINSNHYCRNCKRPRLAVCLVLYSSLLLLFNNNATAAAFRPPPLSNELGCSPTLSILLSLLPTTTNNNNKLFYFDPLGLATDRNFSRLRETELKLSRIAMLAMLETMVVPVFKKVGWLLPSSSSSILEGFRSLTWSSVLKVVSVCGWLELFVFVQRDPTDMPGDYGIGYFGVRNKGRHERSLVSELENGRLAMVAFVVQVIMEVVTGKAWDEQWTMVLQKWVEEQQQQ